jgi:pimeloyl-ACP methyl ester carboxylesterase
MRYKRKKFMIVGLSFGFIVATRMLQRYPELTKKVTVLISLVGFAHKDDFTFSKPRYNFYLNGCRIISQRIPAVIFRETLLRPWVLRRFYGRTKNAKKKFALAEDQAVLEELKTVEVGLWRDNDPRTWAFSTIQMLKLDNCKVKVDLPVWHVAAKNDSYFDNHIVEQHMRVIFNDFETASFDMAAHAPSVLATEEEAAFLLPSKLARYLARMK